MSHTATNALQGTPSGESPSLLTSTAAIRALPDPPDLQAPQRPAPRLEIPRYDIGAALALRRELGVSHTLAQVLVRRGLSDSRAAMGFLRPAAPSSPAAFDGIERAVDLVNRHVAAGSRIVIHGDYDVDGVCATAIMVRALRALRADVHWFLPSRIDDGYGLSLETVAALARRGTGLLITVDCGITAVGQVEAARAAGIDVLVTDHHNPRPDGGLPDCPIVHPVVSSYPCAELCGTGVAFKLALALGASSAEDDLELVALATVADLVPLLGENRRLVQDGLRALACTSRPGLRALMLRARVDPSALDAGVLGFRLAPRINAAGRLRRADAGLELLLTEDETRADEIAQELEAVNAERRAVEQKIAWEAEAQISERGDAQAYVLASEDWHPGVVGIVASRMVERHHRPTILIALDGEVGTGSGRSIPGFDLLAALHAGSAELLQYGGHRAAAGLTLERCRLHAFRAAIESHCKTRLTDELLQPLERIDAVVSGSELSLPLAEELSALEPCGVGNPRPRLLVPGARFENVRAIGAGKHAKFSVASAGSRASAVAFGCHGSLGIDAGAPADASFRLERNVWNGTVGARLVLGHARPPDPPPIEVLGQPPDYVAAVIEEIECDLLVMPSDARGEADPTGEARTLVDRRGQSLLAVLTDAKATGEAVLGVCLDVSRRLSGLSSRVGGFALISYQALSERPDLSHDYPQVVALDPPTLPALSRLLYHGRGLLHWAWGEPELRFAQQMHELEYGLRPSLAALYRSLRARGRVAGEELEHLLRGDGPHSRSAYLAGRLVRVLAELELVSLDRDLPALAIAGTAPTILERSPAYRVYAQRYEDGLRYLSSANHRPSD